MKYIIMADGKGTRWHNYNETPKHLIEIDGETLIARTVRLVKSHGEGDYRADEIIITSHDPRYEVEGAVRYEPKNNVLEIDRFTVELIGDDVCFLYGDTYYSEAAMSQIMDSPVEDVLFFGNGKSVVAVKIKSGELFMEHFLSVRQKYIDGEISGCKGWHVYRSIAGLPLESKETGKKFIFIHDRTDDFNTPEDYDKLYK